MDKPLILAFGYEARSGKGECCDTIYQRHSRTCGGQYDILRISFADRLREEIHERLAKIMRYRKLGVQDAMKALCDWAGVEYDPNPVVDKLNPYGKQRKLQQWYGTEYRRAQDPDYWLNIVRDQARVVRPQIVLIDDMRYENEHGWVYEEGVTVKTARIGVAPINGIAGHRSENAIAHLPFHYYITANDGQVDWLRVQALNLFDFVIARKEAH